MLSLHVFLNVPLANRHWPSEKPDSGLQSPHPTLDQPPLQPNIFSCDKAKPINTEETSRLHSQNSRIKLQQFPKTEQCQGDVEVPTVDDT